MSFKLEQRGGEAGVLDNQVKAFLETLDKGDGTPLSDISPDALRTGPSPTEGYGLESVAVAVTEMFVTVRASKKIRIRIYRKDPQKVAPVLIYFHGGCWVFCSLDSHDPICRQLCYDSGMTVISVDYRLAPEAKFPAAIDDAYDVTKWIVENKDLLKIADSDPILSGDSAGGNIACVTTLRACETQEFKVGGQLLFYPITDVSQKAESYKDFSKGYFLTEELMDYGVNHYMNHEGDKLNPYMSPMLSDYLSVLPKTLIQTAEFDVLRDEAEAFAQKLHETGVEVQCVRYNGAIHAYAALAGGVHLGREALADAVDFLRRFP